MNEHLSKLSDSIIEACKGYLARGLEPILARLTAVEGREPVKGKDGENGKDADIKEVAALVSTTATEMVKEIVAALPKPKDGEDGKSVAAEDVEAMVKRQVEALPKAEPGKDADADAITAAVTDKVLKALEDIPKPKDGEDGKDFDIEQVRGLISDEIQQAVGRLPPAAKGEDGKSVTLDEVAPLISEQVKKAVEAIELPEPIKGDRGQDADPEAIAAVVLERVAKQIPAPIKGEAGKDADPELIRAEVKKAIEGIELPAPVKGEDGKSVELDEVRALLDELVQKAVGNIRQPKDGEPGRDAIQTIPLLSLDVERSYPIGTYALHGGGRVVSFRTTTPGEIKQENGWAVDTNGIDDIGFEIGQDGRTFGFAVRQTNSNVVLKTFKVPVMIDRGVFDYEKEFDAGDVVTWAGALWIAQKDGLKGIEPRSSDGAWRLAVKRGRDGKDGVYIPPSTPKQVKVP